MFSDLLLVDFDKRKRDLDTIKISIKELQERHVLLKQQIRTNTAKANEMTVLSNSAGLGALSRGGTGGFGGGLLSAGNPQTTQGGFSGKIGKF